MIEVMKYKTEHMDYIMEQEATAYLNQYISRDQYKALESHEHAYTIKIDNEIIACAGVVEYWKGRGEAWAILDSRCKKKFIELHNVVKRFLEVVPIKRIEAAVDSDFIPGHRWVKSLGFKLEAERRQAYRHDGGDCALYARVK